jgi:hypothetical protein
VSQHRWLNAIGQKKAPPRLVGHLYRDTHNRDREKSSELVFVYFLPFKAPNKRFPAFRNRFLGSTNVYLRSGQPVQYLKHIIHGQKLGSPQGNLTLLCIDSLKFLLWCQRVQYIPKQEENPLSSLFSICKIYLVLQGQQSEKVFLTILSYLA